MNPRKTRHSKLHPSQNAYRCGTHHMFYNLAGCNLNPAQPAAGTKPACTTHDTEEHDRMTNWLHERQHCRARRP
ncbi:protein of unknown function (plasmid) [Cupriavidus taiwanensis]|uniref:Uncharacterized protein n=1 Tax=Cupriavidus taiwanensis TaxID=164546 RepID=A0A9Q7V1B7_9BURK|nr:protein of unknown function [Cupriavidus taiwanensis]